MQPKPYYGQRKLPLEIKKSNEFVRAQLRIENNALANKIFYFFIRALDANHFPDVKINAKELASEHLAGVQYKAVKDACRVLHKAGVEKNIFSPAGKEIGFEFDNIFLGVHYLKGVITAKFNPGMRPHLLELKNRFTTLNYFELMDLPSYYSQRIYELLKSWEKPDGFVELDLESFYDMISYPKEQRKNFASLRRKALEQAEKDINTRTELRYSWEPIKEGNKVKGLRFIMGEAGAVTVKKRKNKETEKARKEQTEEARQRAPHLRAASVCRKERGLTGGGTCKLYKSRSQKCKYCLLSGVIPEVEPKLF
jgi:plasmid replication initiation protein